MSSLTLGFELGNIEVELGVELVELILSSF